MIDHISLAVSDLALAAAFYEKILAPLGYEILVRRERSVGLGKQYPEVWLNLREGMATPGGGAHVALRARDRDAVTAYHAAALAAGGQCAGPPGPRQATNPGYFAAFITDPFGNRIEAVTFEKS